MMSSAHRIRVLWLALLLLLNVVVHVNAQRFMRQGFSGNEDFGAEMKLEDSEGAVDMTREMFLMQDLKWQLQPLDDNCYASITDRALRRHLIRHGVDKPIALTLLKKRGKFGLRAIGTTEKGQRLRAFWRPAATPPRGSVDFLKASYEEACRARLFNIEFELQLPPLKGKSRNGNGGLPSVVYQLAVEPGSVNPKALVPRSSARVTVYPNGRGGSARPESVAVSVDSANGSSTATTTSSTAAISRASIAAGTARVTVAPIKAGLVDPSWAKGRPIFRPGRSCGLM